MARFSCKLIGAARRDSLPQTTQFGDSPCGRKSAGTAGKKTFFGRGSTRSSIWGIRSAKLAATIDWGFLEQRFGAVYSDAPGHPPLPTRLMAGLADPQAHARPLR